MDHSTHHGSIYIPDNEYLERVAKAAALLRREGLDAMIVNGTESDYANPRYFSGYWPLFERAGVAISAGGDAALMCGPESRHFAGDRSRLDKVFVLKEYREGADPAYPELVPDTFHGRTPSTMCSRPLASRAESCASAWLASWIRP